MTNLEKVTIPEGYKQTEVGVIPEDWSDICLGELVSITSGESPSQFKFIDQGIPYFKVEQLNYHPKYAEKTDYYFESGKTVLAGSVVFPKRGASILLNKIRIFKRDSYLDTNLMALTTNEALLSEFLFYFLSYEGLDQIADTTSIPQINNKHIIPFAIPLPPLKEQAAIANALSDVDNLIASLETLIAKKSAIKTAAMQQLLTGKTRLPAFANQGEGQGEKQGSDQPAGSGSMTETSQRKDSTQTAPRPGYKQTELGEVPEGWEVVPLGGVCDFENGDRSSNYPSPGSFVHSGIPFINAGHVSKGKISKKDMNYITSETYERLGGGKVKAGDVLFCLRGSLGKYGIVDTDFGLGAIASSMVIVRPNLRKMTLGFLKSYFDSSKCEDMIELWAGGAAQPNLGAQEMAKFSVLLPSNVDEQTAIANVLSDMDAELDALQQRLSKTQQIKQGMMQELLTGKTRLV